MKTKNGVLMLLLLIYLSSCQKAEIKSENNASAIPTKNMSKSLSVTISSLPALTISGNKFYTNGKQIFFNGINTAWQKESDYSIDYLDRNYDPNYWNSEFTRYNQNHINLARIWLNGSGAYAPGFDANGYVLSPDATYLSNLDGLIQKAVDWNSYIMPTLMSFDMAKDSKATQFRNMITDVNKANSYINNYLIPIVKRYNNVNNILGYDLCNEPEHFWRDANCGPLNRDAVVKFFAMCAAAVHKNSSKFVTIGSMWIVYNSDRYIGFNTGGGNTAYTGNNWSNTSLQARYNDAAAYMDFWSTHWYEWQGGSSGPFATSIGYWYENGNKPAVIGETYGGDVNSSTYNNTGNYNITMANYYIQSYQQGYAGVCGWKNPWENDNYGTFNGIANGTNAFYAAYPSLVNP